MHFPPAVAVPFDLLHVGGHPLGYQLPCYCPVAATTSRKARASVQLGEPALCSLAGIKCMAK